MRTPVKVERSPLDGSPVASASTLWRRRQAAIQAVNKRNAEFERHPTAANLSALVEARGQCFNIEKWLVVFEDIRATGPEDAA